MWKDLKELHKNMCFSQSKLEEALEICAKTCAPRWSRELAPQEIKSWKKATATQLRLMARHVQQSQKSAWYVASFRCVDGIDGPDEDGITEEVPPPKETPSFFNGYCREVDNAWRMCANGKKKSKEWATSLDSSKGEFPTAIFSDGAKEEITCIHVCEMPKKSLRSEVPVYFQGKYDGKRVIVKKIADKDPEPILVVLYIYDRKVEDKKQLQPRQACQMGITALDADPEVSCV